MHENAYTPSLPNAQQLQHLAPVFNETRLERVMEALTVWHAVARPNRITREL